jgi:very-short-patch-repair endonuclease
MGDRPQRDARRDGWLKSRGICVARFAATEVLDNLDGVVRTIAEMVRL